MKIGFDISQTGARKAGCGYFAESLILQLADLDQDNQYTLYPLFGDAYCDPPLDAETVQVNRPGWHRGPVQKNNELARVFWTDPPDDFERQIGSVDIVHANNFFCPTGLNRTKLVYTLYDLSFVERPDLSTEQNRAQVFNGVFNASILADHIIAISHSTRDHFLNIFPHYPSRQITVVHPGSRFSASDEVTQRPAALDRLTPGRFWLSVGTLEPRKNHHRLLEAYALLKRRHPDTPPLVLAGANGWLMSGFDQMAENLGIRQDIILTGYVDDRALRWLYQNCLGFCYPSLFEGFGLPVLEAMTLGAAVITSEVSSLPEIVGDAGLLIDPTDSAALAQAMEQLQCHPECRETSRQKLRKRAALFDWRNAARQILDIYQQVASPDSSEVATADNPRKNSYDTPLQTVESHS